MQWGDGRRVQVWKADNNITMELKIRGLDSSGIGSCKVLTEYEGEVIYETEPPEENGWEKKENEAKEKRRETMDRAEKVKG